MNIANLRKVLPFLIENRLTPWLWGYHGKGKSETVQTWCKENGYLCFDFRLNTMADVGDFLGLQDFVRDSTTGESVATKFCMPEWLKAAFDFTDKNPTKWAVIFVDEVNRPSRRDLIGPLFQMALDFRLHTFDFSDKKIALVMASNPPTSDYSGVLSLTDKALLSRFCHINFAPPKEEFFSYAQQKGLSSDVVEFLKTQPEYVEETDLETFSISDFAKPDRRKWVRGVAKVDTAAFSPELRVELLAGMVGTTAAIAYEKFLESREKPFEVKDVLNNYKKIRAKVKAATSGDKRLDLLNDISNKIIAYFEDDPEITPKQVKNVLTLIEDLPNEQMYSILVKIYLKRRFFDVCEEHVDKWEELKNITERVRQIKSTFTENTTTNETSLSVGAV